MKRLAVSVESASCSTASTSGTGSGSSSISSDIVATSSNGDSVGDRSSVLTRMMRISSALACATMRFLGQADYAAMSRCSRFWRRVSLQPEATPYAVRFGRCWRDVSFGALEHLRPHRLDVVPDLGGRACASVAPRDGVEHRRCDWRRVVPLLRSPGIRESVGALRLSLSAHESPETVAEFVAALAAMTHLTGFQLYMDVPGGVLQRPHGATVASLIGARAASLVRLGISGASFAIGDTDATIAALAECTSLRQLMLQVRSDWMIDWMIRAPTWARISRLTPTLTKLCLIGVNAHTLREFASAVRGAVDPEYDPIAANRDDDDAVDGDARPESAASTAPPPPIERAFMQLESLDIRVASDAPPISLVPMPNLVRLKVVGGRRPVPAPASPPLPPLTTVMAETAATPTTTTPPATSETSASQSSAVAPTPPTLVYQTSVIALDDREYRRTVPSAHNRTANLINDVPECGDPKRAHKLWASLRELELDAIAFIGNELNRLPALKMLTLGPHVQVNHAFAWSLSHGSQLHRRAVHLGRTAEQQQQMEKKSRSSSSSSGAVDADPNVITTADEPTQPYRLAAIVVATTEIVDVIRRLGVDDAWRLMKK